MFKFKGISSEQMKVVCEEESNFLKKASLLVENLIESNNSDLEFLEIGYDNVDGNINLFVLDKTKLDDIKSWLNGIGELQYNDRISKIAFTNNYEVVRKATIYTLKVDFTRSPFWYKLNDDFVVCKNSIVNEGNVYSYPIIKLEKNNSSKIDLSINNVRFSYAFPNDEQYVEIDCKKANAFFNGLYRSSNLTITYNFPKINPGQNSLIIHEGDAIVKIKRKDCWL